MKKKTTIMLISFLTFALLFVGCAKKEEAATTKIPVLKSAMVTDIGGVNDQSYNQSAWEGMKKSQSELGFEVNYVESNQAADYATNMETLYDSNNDLIWGIGFIIAEPMMEAANANPEQMYAIIDDAATGGPSNLLRVMFKAQEPSFLVGYIAGKMTKTNKVGFVGGIKFALIENFEYGFKAGVKYANPDATVFDQYAESFSDAAKGKAIASGMYQNGADIVFHAAGGVGDGVIEAAKEQEKWAIGADRDQNSLAPENVLTSAMKLVGNAIYNVHKDLKEGNFEGGKVIVYGLAEDGVGIAPTSSKHVPAEILAQVDEVTNKIISGEIVVPFDAASFNKF